jgi:spoIIIJ-associated protein
MSQRFEGKNVEEALGNAAATLGVQRYQLTYHVLLEKRGFLGGVKRVVIEADVNTAATEAPPQAQAPEAGPQQARAPRERRPSRGGGGGRERGGRDGGAGREGGSRWEGRRGPRNGRDRGERLPPRRREAMPLDLPPQEPESENATTVRAWIEEVIRLGRFDLQIRTTESDEQIVVRFFGGDGELLLDRHGELLDALQVLANKAMTGRRVQKDIEMDCEQFKERRVEELEQRARETADRVRRDGREQLLPAMSPIERRIVHLALQDDREVTTQSRGDGFFKRVAIILRPAGGPEPQPTTTES